MTWGFRFFETVTPIKPDATFVTQRVWFGDKSEVNLGAGEAGSVTIPRGQLKNLKASYTLTEPQLTAPLKKGQVVGTIDFQLNGKSIEQRPLIVMEKCGRGRILWSDVGFRDDEIPSVVRQLVLLIF